MKCTLFSAGPIIDLFITFLSLGADGYKKLLSDRKLRLAELKNEVTKLTSKYNYLKLLNIPHNDISMGIGFINDAKVLQHSGGFEPSYSNSDDPNVTKFGSMLFTRFVSGARVVPRKNQKAINGVQFQGYGSHVDCYHCDYLTVAAAIGIKSEDIDLFIKRFDKILAKNLCMKPREVSDTNAGEESKSDVLCGNLNVRNLENDMLELNLWNVYFCLIY